MNAPAIFCSVAALVLAFAPQGTASAATQSAKAAVARPPSTGAAVPTGNVSVTLPGSSIGRSDGIDGAVTRGHTYRAEFLVWIAPNAGSATLVLHADGSALTRCIAARLRPGTTSAVMCLVRADPHPNASAVSLGVVVRTSDLGTFSRTFTHALTR